MATINYENKEAVSEFPSIPAKNKFTDDDANLIKTVGNQILTTLGVYTDDWSSSATYLVDDVVVYDNRYFKNLTGTNTATTPDEDATNWLEVSIRDISGGAEIPIQDTAPTNPRDDDLWIDTSEESGGENILDVIFPVGSIVIKADNQDYSNWLGFTWERTLVGRVAVGIDTTQTEFDTMGKTGGEKKHTLTIDEMPSHNHKVYRSGSTSAGYGSLFQNTSSTTELTANVVDNTGGGQAHNNLQPYQVVAYWKRTA